MKATKNLKETLTETLVTDLKVGDVLWEVHPAGEEHGTLTYEVTRITHMPYNRPLVVIHGEPRHWTCGIRLGKYFHLAPTATVTVQTLTES